MYRPDARYTPPPSLGAIRRACWREEAFTIDYTDEHGSVTQRSIPPQAIIYTEGRLVVLAWCRLRAASRMFRRLIASSKRVARAAASGRDGPPYCGPIWKPWRSRMRLERA
ncbi:WYL domain-containing protein [Methylobacterium sp. A49B]